MSKYPPIFQSVPTDEFTDREEVINLLVKRATNTPRGITLSTAIVGQRRLGKTSVMEQIYNRLFWEQDDVVPIYFTFEAKPTTSTEFAEVYFANFLVQYVAFRLKDGQLAGLDNRRIDLNKVVALAESLKPDPIANYAGPMLYMLNSDKFSLHQKLEAAIYLPREVMEYNRLHFLPETPIFVMLDEFQDVLRINYSDGKPADTVGLYQWAVEGRKCPHFVTGSAVRLITQEVLGTGALFGRFRFMQFKPLADIYGLELVDKLAQKYGVTIEEPVAGYLTRRCGGNSFYIRCVMMQALEQERTQIETPEAVNDLIAHEVTHGQIWRDWSAQLQKYFQTINSYYISKQILFVAAQFKDQRIVPEEIAQQVKRPKEEVLHALKQLAFAEMIDSDGGYIFHNLKDPILRDFINSQYELDIAKRPWEQVHRSLLQQYKTLKRKYDNLVGALVEARIEALLNRFDNREIEGRLFNVSGQVELPRFTYVSDAYVKQAGQQSYQIDLKASWHKGYDYWLWVVEIKNWDRHVTPSVVKKFIEAYTALEHTEKPEGMIKWIVNQGGFSPGAIKVLEEHNIYYSTAAEINELLHLFGIQRLLSFDIKSKAGKQSKRKSKKGQQVESNASLMKPKVPPQAASE